MRLVLNRSALLGGSFLVHDEEQVVGRSRIAGTES
jgi:hypothetical protein